MTALKPYRAYRESGVDWLGKVPEHWQVVGLGYRYEQCLGKMLDSKRITGEHLVPYLRNVDVQWDKINVVDLPRMDIHPDEMPRYTVQRGDLLVCEGGEVGRCAIWKGEIDHCGFQKALHRLRPREDERDRPRFLYYALSVAVACGAFADGQESTIAHLTGEKLRRHRFAFPSSDEQTAIARFLDDAERHIRRYIGAKEKLLALLEEQKRAVIHQAVTGRVDVRTGKPYRAYRDSGVEWLGKVPEHWEIRRIKHTVRTSSKGIQIGPFGSSLTQLRDENTGYKLYGQEHTISGDFRRGSRWITQEHFRQLRRYELFPNDVVLTRKGSLGKCRLVPRRIERGIMDSDTIRVRLDPTIVDQEFMVLLLHRAAYLRSQIESVQRGAVLRGLNTSTIANLHTALPPIGEQRQIKATVETFLDRIGSATDAVDRQIQQIAQFRTRLISDVVTGKLDVREAAAELQGAEPAANGSRGARTQAPSDSGSARSSITAETA